MANFDNIMNFDTDIFMFDFLYDILSLSENTPENIIKNNTLKKIFDSIIFINNKRYVRPY